MKKDVVPVEIRGILPANSGCAIFVGNDEKVFVIQVEHNMGAVIGMFLRDTPKDRPPGRYPRSRSSGVRTNSPSSNAPKKSISSGALSWAARTTKSSTPR